MIPAILVVFGLSFGIYRQMTSPKNLFVDTYGEMRSLLRQIEQILDNYLTIDSRKEELDLCDRGRLVCLLHIFEDKVNSLIGEERQLLFEDIADLSDSHHYIGRKLAVVNRMYHTYAFLRPS